MSEFESAMDYFARITKLEEEAYQEKAGVRSAFFYTLGSFLSDADQLVSRLASLLALEDELNRDQRTAARRLIAQLGDITEAVRDFKEDYER